MERLCCYWKYRNGGGLGTDITRKLQRKTCVNIGFWQKNALYRQREKCSHRMEVLSQKSRSTEGISIHAARHVPSVLDEC